jgi:lipopolysaccharide export system permease protein
MRLLDRYLLRELLVPLSYCFGGFLIFWISFDLFSEIDDFQENKLKAADIAQYYLVRTPEVLSIALPVALLLALLYALTNHARHHELTAMRAAGVSLWRLSLPYLGVGFLCSVLLFVINEFWVPDSIERAEDIRNRYTQSATRDWRRDLFFRNEAEGRLWESRTYNLNTHTFSNVHIVWNLPDGSWRDLYAESASWSNKTWSFSQAQEWSYLSRADMRPAKIETNLLVRPEYDETPELIKSELKVNTLSSIQAAKRPQLSIQEIRNYFRLHPKPPAIQAAILDTQFHARIAEAWTCLVVVLIAIPFGAPSGRRNVFVGVAASIFICFAYYILLRLSLTFGTSGRFPPFVAAWSPNVLFGLAGIILTFRVR